MPAAELYRAKCGRTDPLGELNLGCRWRVELCARGLPPCFPPDYCSANTPPSPFEDAIDLLSVFLVCDRGFLYCFLSSYLRRANDYGVISRDFCWFVCTINSCDEFPTQDLDAFFAAAGRI